MAPLSRTKPSTHSNRCASAILHQPYSFMGWSSFLLAPRFGDALAIWGARSPDGFQVPQSWVYGKDLLEGIFRSGQCAFTQDETNIFESSLIVLWGFNSVSLMSSRVGHNLLQARERGIPIIYLGLRYSPSVEVLADQWIPIRPTTDAAMMTAMANVWFKEDLCDREFVAKWMEREGEERSCGRRS